jgi:hypothetical protein
MFVCNPVSCDNKSDGREAGYFGKPIEATIGVHFAISLLINAVNSCGDIGMGSINSCLRTSTTLGRDKISAICRLRVIWSSRGMPAGPEIENHEIGLMSKPSSLSVGRYDKRRTIRGCPGNLGRADHSTCAGSVLDEDTLRLPHFGSEYARDTVRKTCRPKWHDDTSRARRNIVRGDGRGGWRRLTFYRCGPKRSNHQEQRGDVDEAARPHGSPPEEVGMRDCAHLPSPFTRRVQLTRNYR